MSKLLIFSFLIFIFSCSQQKKTEKEVDWNQEKSTQLNKNLSVEEEINIDLFLEEHKDWMVQKTGSGLRYWIYEKGKGAEATASVDSLSDQFPAKITSTPLRSVLSRLILFMFTD